METEESWQVTEDVNTYDDVNNQPDAKGKGKAVDRERDNAGWDEEERYDWSEEMPPRLGKAVKENKVDDGWS